MLTGLLLLLLGANLSHAANHSAAPHEHDGVLCVLSLQDETIAVIPAPTEKPVAPALSDTPTPSFHTHFTNTPKRSYRGREPPPRGPPSFLQT